MNDEYEKIIPLAVAGIKKTVRKQKLSSKRFSESGVFSSIDEQKIYVPGKGIVHSFIENIVFFDCGHMASKENYGGICEYGHVVCRECLFLCAHPGCFRRLCTIRGCSRKIVDGEMFCKPHGYMKLLFGLAGSVTGRKYEREIE